MNNDFINFPENYANLDDKGKRLEALVNLSQVLLDREKRIPITFNDFLYLTLKSPQYVLRDIFQLFFDMIHYYIPEGVEDYPERGESVGYVRYDAENLFVRGCDDPFFADRLFINRFMNMIESFKQGSLNNHIFLFEGPPGSGKSTFLNNILLKLEEYTRTNDGAFFKTYWNIDVERLGGYKEMVKHLQSVNLKIDEELGFENHKRRDEDYEKKHLQFSCPRHDHPILHIPKSYRKQFLDELIPDEKFKEDLFFKNEYEWVLKEVPCNICQSLFSSLLEILSDPLEVFSMIFVRKMHFNRQFGEGISVYNPGDKLFEKPIENASLEKMLHNILKNDSLQFIYSDLAKTNNGVLALMDIKEDNIERLKGLHGIISDGVHKVELVEERIKSLFVGLVNPEDKIHYEGIKSFQDRIITVNIPYILDYNTEVAIYKNKFGKNIESRFLPGVLENFAKIIISSRMDIDTPVIKKWLGSIDKYSKYLDKYALLLKMEIYTGKIPDYLSEEDLKKFNRQVRKEILIASDNEGKKGFSGRQSLNIYGDFVSKYSKSDDLITMDMVQKFFSNSDRLYKEIPAGFLLSLCDMYDYNVLQEVKESIYYYNDTQITRDILNYLFSINFEPGDVKRSTYTGDTIEIEESYFKNIESIFLGASATVNQRKVFRADVRNEYITKTLSQEINLQGKKIADTDQFQFLFDKYTRNLKEFALNPYSENDNFRRAISDYGTDTFNAYDDRIKRDIRQLIKNLQNKFKYSENGAKEVSLYVLFKGLNKKYS